MDLHGIHCMNLMNLALFFILLSTVLIQCGSSSTPKQQKQNNIVETLNPSKRRIPLKTIKSRDGDIIDCIKISEQPAFDHPLLHNHTILTTPSFYPQGMLYRDDHHENQITQLWSSEGSCPDGTIPIRRPEANSTIFKNYGRNKHPGNTSFSSQSVEPDGNTEMIPEYAFAFLKDYTFHGAKGNLNAWQPQVQNPGEYSSAQIWVSGGPTSEISSVETGWHVAPDVYGGDKSARFFIYWKEDGYDSGGCYNLLCPGFVQISKRILLGGVIEPMSTYHGDQFEIRLTIWKDSAQHAWWLGFDKLALGYWPEMLFKHLQESASSIQWGGKVLDSRPNGEHTTTQMGSGHFAEEGFGGATYFSHLKVMDESDNMISPPIDDIGTSVELAGGCYSIVLNKNNTYENYILFGGPGKNPNCP